MVFDNAAQPGFEIVGMDVFARRYGRAGTADGQAVLDDQAADRNGADGEFVAAWNGVTQFEASDGFTSSEVLQGDGDVVLMSDLNMAHYAFCLWRVAGMQDHALRKTQNISQGFSDDLWQGNECLDWNCAAAWRRLREGFAYVRYSIFPHS